MSKFMRLFFNLENDNRFFFVGKTVKRILRGAIAFLSSYWW